MSEFGKALIDSIKFGSGFVIDGKCVRLIDFN